MSNKLCKCGHLKTEHLDYIYRLDTQKNRSYRENVVIGLGKCKKCECDYFKK